MSLLSKAARLFGGKSTRHDLRSHSKDEARKRYQSHLHDRDTAIAAAVCANSTQEMHHQRNKAMAATCAAMVMELDAGRFDYKPTAQEVRDGMAAD